MQIAQYPKIIPLHPRKKRWRRWIWLIPALLLLLFLACAGIAGYVGWNLTHPVRKPLTRTPADYGLSYRNIQFTDPKDGTKLSGWLIPAQPPSDDGKDRVVIFAHGYAMNRMADEPALPLAKSLATHGFSVMMFDFRDSGSSAGSLVTVGAMEQYDLQSAIEFVVRHPPRPQAGPLSIGLVGFSMGASTAAIVGSENPDVKAMVLDSPFADLNRYLQSHMTTWTHLPDWPFTPLILWEIPKFLGLHPETVSPVHEIDRFAPRKILFIHGDADQTVPESNTRELYAAAHNPQDELWLVPGAVHVGSHKVAPALYEKKVVDFFTQNL